MNEEVGSATVLLVGALLVRLSLSGAYARYVRVGMGPWLLTAGVLLAALGAVGVMHGLARPRPSTPDTPDTGHAHGERVGWLLLAPVVALLMITPPALGSFGVDRSTAVAVSSGGRTFDSLPAGATVTMTVLEFDERAADHDGSSFGSAVVRLTGFVAPTAGGAAGAVAAGTTGAAGFRLARYQIACCAADAVAAVAMIVGAVGDPPARDTWVTVTGTYQGSSGAGPKLLVSSLVAIPAPPDPYE